MQSGDLRLVVGLGNPGQKYVGTRHNVGFMALEAYAAAEQSRFRSMAKLQGEVAEVGIGSGRIRLLMPQTFMNESGRSIRAALDWFDLSADQVLVLDQGRIVESGPYATLRHAAGRFQRLHEAS